MKIVTIGDYYRIGPVVAARHGIELFVLAHPRMVERDAGHPSVDGAYPYHPRYKLDPRAAHQVRDVVASVKPDLLHGFGSRPLASAVLGTLGMRDAPPIVSYRGIVDRASYRDPANFITYRHARVVAHACESNAARDALIASRIAPDACTTVYPCVWPSRLEPSRRSARESLGIPIDAFVVGTIATIRPVKRIDLLLRAALRCTDLPNLYWLLIGPVRDPRVALLARHPRIRDRVRLPGYRIDAAALIRGADVMALPSRRDSIARALLEAMAAGVCPMVSDSGGLKEAVRHGQDGLVFRRGNLSELIDTVRTLYADRDRMRTYAHSAQRRARELFSPEQMSDRLIQFYRRVLAG